MGGRRGGSGVTTFRGEEFEKELEEQQRLLRTAATCSIQRNEAASCLSRPGGSQQAGGEWDLLPSLYQHLVSTWQHFYLLPGERGTTWLLISVMTYISMEEEGGKLTSDRETRATSCLSSSGRKDVTTQHRLWPCVHVHKPAIRQGRIFYGKLIWERKVLGI